MTGTGRCRAPECLPARTLQHGPLRPSCVTWSLCVHGDSNVRVGQARAVTNSLCDKPHSPLSLSFPTCKMRTGEQSEATAPFHLGLCPGSEPVAWLPSLCPLPPTSHGQLPRPLDESPCVHSPPRCWKQEMRREGQRQGDRKVPGRQTGSSQLAPGACLSVPLGFQGHVPSHLCPPSVTPWTRVQVSAAGAAWPWA